MTDGEKKAPDSEADMARTETNEMNEDGMHESAFRMARELGISMEEAERAVMSRSGMRGTQKVRSVGSISELGPDLRGIAIKARVISVVQGTRSEGKGFYHYGLLGDSTGDTPFTSWIAFPFQPGDALLISNCSTREYGGRLELVIGDNTIMDRLEDSSNLLPPIDDVVPMRISELVEGMKNVDVIGRVDDLQEVNIEVRGTPRLILNGSLLDGSGRLGFTCWGPIEMDEGACYRIVGGTVRSYRNSLKLNFDPGSIVKRLPDDVLPEMEELIKPVPYRVYLIGEGLIPGPVTLRGIALDIRPGSGLVRKCNECGRRMQKGQCSVHGRSEGEDDLRLRAVLDDGSGTIMARAGRDIVESLLGRSMASLLEEAKKNMSSDFIVEELRERLVGHCWTISGDPGSDDYGPSLFVSSMEPGLDNGLLSEEVMSMAEVLR